MTRSIRTSRSCADAATTDVWLRFPGQAGKLNTVGVRTGDDPNVGSVQVALYVARGLRQDRDPYGDGILARRQPVRGSTVTDYGPNDAIVAEVTNNSGDAVTVELTASVTPERVAPTQEAKNG